MARLAAVAAATLLVTACASHGGGPAAARTVDVTMKDLRFAPASVSVRQGETVRFAFVNKDTVDHDAFLGTAAEQARHEEQMHAGGHAHGDAVLVRAGDRGTITHTFADAGTYEIGCHVPGHYAGGMTMLVAVT